VLDPQIPELSWRWMPFYEPPHPFDISVFCDFFVCLTLDPVALGFKNLMRYFQLCIVLWRTPAIPLVVKPADTAVLRFSLWLDLSCVGNYKEEIYYF
jgi:hypothetical protein